MVLSPGLFRHIQENEAPDSEGSGFALDLDAVWADIVERTRGVADLVISLETLWQVLAIIVAATLGYVVSRVPKKQLLKFADKRRPGDILRKALQSLALVVFPIFTVFFLWIGTAIFSAIEGQPNEALRVCASLLNAWIVVRLVTSNLKDGFWQTAIALTAWTIAALYILRLLDPVTESLDAAVLKVGGQEFTLLRVLTSLVLAAIALWVGRIAGDAAQSQLKSTKSLNPSIAGLLGQTLKIGFMTAAILLAISFLGVDLTALAVFGGALGVGIGFGLQAIFSNFISGIIILFERSIKVGDFIELQTGVTGQVREINIRSTLVTTNDNVDILVPNEEFIKAQVINWTLRETRRRMRIGFGVAYGSDKELVKKAGLEAAEAVRWTFDDIPGREPQVWLTGFGDSSLDFELVVWLTEDAVPRPAKVKADYYWALHTALYKYELEIPFPQRDLNFRNQGEIRVTLDRGDGTPPIKTEG